MTERAAIDAETLMAYADGELSPLEAKRVERAIAADPALQEQVDAHRKLRAMLANGFAPVLDAPVPDRLTALLAPSPVVRIDRARGGWRARAARVPMQRWGTGIAIAASLVIGVFVGQLGTGNAPVETRGGALIASGRLARALDTQLASVTAPAGAPRILVSFRDAQGTPCRAFADDRLTGIACHDAGGGWTLRETRGRVGAAPSTDYRQAGSADADLLADAQAMMAGDPLNAAAEAKAIEQRWR